MMNKSMYSAGLTCAFAILGAACLSGCVTLSASDTSGAQAEQPAALAEPAPQADPPEVDNDRADEPLAAVEIASKPVEFESLGDRLSGVIQYPEGMTTPGPAVLIVHDAGPRDRQGHFQTEFGLKLPAEVPVYQELAENLVRHGFVVMRFDKRTCVKGGRARCEYPRAYVEAYRAELARALKADVRAAAERLRRDARVDAPRLFLLGHGQGADIALALADAVDPAGLVLLSPSPYPVDTVILHQTEVSLKYLKKRRKNEGNTTTATLLDQQIDALEAAKKLQKEGFSALRAGDYTDAELLGAPADTWRGLFELHAQAAASLERVELPILAIFGQSDETLPPSSAAKFRKSMARAPASAPPREVVELPEMTHFMVEIDESSQALNVSDEVQQRVVEFLYAQPEVPSP